VTAERPFADGRRTAVLVFNELRVGAGRLTQAWLDRLRALDAAGWATHAALVNKDPGLARTVRTLVSEGLVPAATSVHHYAQRDKRVRDSWWGRLPPGWTTEDRIADWLDWLTGQVPGAVVFADSPAAYPYVARMTNPLVARVAGIHLNHLATDPGGSEPALGPLSSRFADHFADAQQHFDALVVMTSAQADDLRTRFGPDTPVVVIPPSVPGPAPAADASTAPVPGAGPERRVVSIGALEPPSGHDRAVRALHALSASHPDVVLDVRGEGEQAEDLADLVAELGLTGRVRFGPTPGDPYEPFRGALATVWAGRRESCPLAIVRSLAAGVPVVAWDARYGPGELVTGPEVGDLVDDDDALAAALARRVDHPADPDDVRSAAAGLIGRTQPPSVGARWVALAAELADRVHDHRSPVLLADPLATTSRVIRASGALADAAGSLDDWTFELPELREPAGWLTTPSGPASETVADDDEVPVHPHAAGPTRDVVVQLRSNALAFVAVERGAGFRIEFTDGRSTAALRTPAFADRILASRVGNALLRHRSDGSVWVEPYPHLILASNVEGSLLVRTDEDAPASDITHAIDWAVDLAWDDLAPVPEGAAFHGTLRAIGIAPADDSPPAICVSDVGGFSRIVGQLHYTSEPRADGLQWTADVAGVLETDPLVATTTLARGALALHVGFRGLLVPVGGLWTHGRRTRIVLSCERGEVTLLPSPGGRVLVAPGKGVRARLSGAVRSVVSRG
jgi:glycosyltransferase involved in cell wall biosynthesis